MSDLPKLGERVLNFIDGAWRESESDRWTQRYDPADQSILVAVAPDSTRKDAAAAVESASRAHEGWAAMPAPNRGRLLFKWLRWIDERREAIADLLTREEGKTLPESLGEVSRSIDILEHTAGMGRRLSGTVFPSEEPGVFCYSVPTSVGVAGLITPWNFPVAIPVWKMAPALIAGNTVVLKPSPLTPLTAGALVRGLEEVGIPQGVVNLVYGDSEPAIELIDNPSVGAVSFTGSTKTGKAIARAAAARLLKLQLELGGKNPMIILNDVDIDLALSGVVIGAFGSTGQRCTATSRAIVEAGVYDKFLDALIKRASAIKIGAGNSPGVEIGPLVDSKAISSVSDYIEVGRQDGGTFLIGGGRMSGPEYDRGFFFSPTVIEASSGMKIAQEEVFGPVLSVIRATDLNQAIELANCVRYGLTASIYTRDVSRVFKFANQIKAGMVHVNRPSIGGYSHAPFGGIKDSGYGGREVGSEVMDFYTETKTVYINHQPLN